ncbi:MAG TPA: DUF6029 family protein [Candidatus Cloacimonas acidaminovorans]|nr:DUF6029 family protein [Candidatus Cloacimonas acidaminovorans]
MKHTLLLLLLISFTLLSAQNVLFVNGSNEAKFIYRTVEDSLHTYFNDTFGFNLAYRNFSFGMKFIAELPKYSTEQTELLDELDSNRLELGWQELYASYEKDACKIYAGITEESFGNGIVFRSYKDLEFDIDNRLESFLFSYNDAFKFKAIYGAIENPTINGKYDLAYGADLQSPNFRGLSLGASTMAFRNLLATNIYNQRTVFAGRLNYATEYIDLQAETAVSKLYHQPGIDTKNGKAIYVNGSYYFGPVTLGGAYKQYDKFQYRLNDLPTVNYHNETLSDASATGEDEIGWQGFGTVAFTDGLNFTADYAEAFNSDKDKKMNDAFLALEYSGNSFSLLASYSHIEKVDDLNNTWQQDLIPALQTNFTGLKIPVQIQAEYKKVSKQRQDAESEHFEPKLQTNFTLKKLSLSLCAQSNWEDISEIFDSPYWASAQIKLPLFEHSDIILFGGKEAGGKVCRNGVCRYVAPFEGLCVELNTRF